MRRILVVTLAAATFVLPPIAWSAAERIPEESGWSGSINLGAGYNEVESNLIAGNDFADIGKDTVDNIFDSPDSEDDIIPVFSGDIKYTFGKARTQVFFGNEITDLVRYDFAQLLGVRKQWDGVGILGIAAAFSNYPTEVWEDPYLAGEARNETDRDSTGFRFQWSYILDSNFSLKVNLREIDVDKDRSGQALVADGTITPEEQRLLRRDGDNTSFNLEYLWKIGPKQFLVPEIFFTEHDRDGDAETRDVIGGNLTWTLLGDPWSFVLTGSLSASEYDKRNPIYNERADSDNFSVGATTFYKLPTKGRWSLFASAAYGESDSDIDFHDTELLLITAGARWSFGKLPGE